MKKWLMMLAVLVTFCLVGCGEKPMTAVYFQADDNSWYFADLDMISGAFVFQSLTLHPTANPVEPSRKPDPFTITPVVRTP